MIPLRRLVLGLVLVACSSHPPASETSLGSTRATSPAPPAPSTPPAPTAAPTNTAPPADPGPPRVRFVGRFDDRDPAAPKCGWPGCRILLRFRGTRVTFHLDEDAPEQGPSEWDVAVDGVWRSPRTVLELGAHDYDIAGLPDAEHTIELYKGTEAQTGVTTFRGFDLHGGELLPPPLAKTRRIEIVGDSDVAGFGYVGALRGGDCPGVEWAAKYEDFRRAWGQRLADMLSAELNGTVFSGKGFYFNIWRPDTETIGVLYPRANPADPSSRWDTSRFVPDVVVVSIGGNDYNLGLPEDNGPPPFDGFVGKARELTMTLRSAYPNAHVFLQAYAVLTDEYPPGRQRRTNVVRALEQVTAERNAAGDARIYFVAPPEAVQSELTGCDGHGGPEYHARIATFMAHAITSKTGW